MYLLLGLINLLSFFSEEPYFFVINFSQTIFEQAIRHEAFTHIEGQKEFVQIDPNELFPYLLVNIGSGVSMIKVQ